MYQYISAIKNSTAARKASLKKTHYSICESITRLEEELKIAGNAKANHLLASIKKLNKEKAVIEADLALLPSDEQSFKEALFGLIRYVHSYRNAPKTKEEALFNIAELIVEGYLTLGEIQLQLSKFPTLSINEFEPLSIYLNLLKWGNPDQRQTAKNRIKTILAKNEYGALEKVSPSLMRQFLIESPIELGRQLPDIMKREKENLLHAILTKDVTTTESYWKVNVTWFTVPLTQDGKTAIEISAQQATLGSFKELISEISHQKKQMPGEVTFHAIKAEHLILLTGQQLEFVLKNEKQFVLDNEDNQRLFNQRVTTALVALLKEGFPSDKKTSKACQAKLIKLLEFGASLSAVNHKHLEPVFTI